MRIDECTTGSSRGNASAKIKKGGSAFVIIPSETGEHIIVVYKKPASKVSKRTATLEDCMMGEGKMPHRSRGNQTSSPPMPSPVGKDMKMEEFPRPAVQERKRVRAGASRPT